MRFLSVASHICTPASSGQTLAGFAQTGNSWKPIAEHFAEQGFLATVVDRPGHGGSAHVRADLRRTADMLATVDGTGAFVGYSQYKGEQGAKDAGRMRSEGKEYVVKDGDVMNFLFNV